MIAIGKWGRALPPLLLLGMAVLAGGCSGAEEAAAQKTGGDPQRGKGTIKKYGCHACHSIPGVPGADALVGPPLDHIASRAYLAGRIENTPENMMKWIRTPQDVQPGTAMPNMGVSEKDARDIAAFLYTLR